MTVGAIKKHPLCWLTFETLSHYWTSVSKWLFLLECPTWRRHGRTMSDIKMLSAIKSLQFMSDISRALSKPTICCTVSVPGHAWITAFLNKHWGCKQASLRQVLNLLRLQAKSEKSLQIRRPTEAQNVSTEISWKSIKENFKHKFLLL